MAEVKFYLEKRKDKQSGELMTKNVPILLFYSFNGQRLQHFTGLRVDSTKWDAATQRVKRNYPEGPATNRELDQLKAKVISIHERAKAMEDKISIQYFKEKLIPEDAQVPPIGGFNHEFTKYIASSTHTKTPGTLKNLKSTLSILNDFSAKTKFKLEFENIDMEFYEKFLKYCFEERNFRNNYVGKLIKDLKSFMNYATDPEQGYTTNLAFRNKKFKKLTEEPEIIFLTYEELMHFYNFKFENPKFERIKDIFCFGCFTGLRFSDIKNLTSRQIHGDQILYRVIKGGANNTIPLNKFSKSLIAKYKGPTLCFPVISEVKTNEYLKECAFIAGLHREIEITHFQGVKRISETLPLHEAITFHMSKKTFMTNFLAKGGTLHTAMAITGNKDMKTARRYFKVVDSLKEAEMSKVFG